MSIGENLKKLREKSNMTQVELSKSVGVSQSIIAQLERGTKVLTIPLGIEIANVLRCSLIDLAKE